MRASILVPTYNHEKYIAVCLEGICNQNTDFEYEILIGEDGSSDRTRDICIDFSNRYPEKIRLFLNDRKNVIYFNGKPSGRWNLMNLIKNAKGKYIAICEGDDFWNNANKLSIQTKYLDERKNLSFCFHPVNWLNEQTNTLYTYKPTHIQDNYSINNILSRNNFIALCSVVYRAEILQKITNWFKHIPYGDLSLHIFSAIKGNFGYISDTMATYRRHDGGIYSSQSPVNRTIMAIQTLQLLNRQLNLEKFKEYNDGLSRYYNQLAKEAKIEADKITNICSRNSPQIDKKKPMRPNYTVEKEKLSNTICIQYFLDSLDVFYNEKFSNSENLIQAYRANIDYSIFDMCDNRKIDKPLISIVVVAYNTNELLLDCLNSLLKQKYKDFEIILVDNGGNDKVFDSINKIDLLYIKCPINFILSEGRNIGTFYAKGEIVAFLDDDAIVNETYVSTIVEAFMEYDIIGMRGKVLPKTKDAIHHADHYDLGEYAIPSTIDTEGNSAFLKSAYLTVDGMNPLLFGMEGLEISYRLSKQYGLNRIIYWPSTVIFHDYGGSKDKVSKKLTRYAIMRKYVQWKYPDIYSFHFQQRECLKSKQSIIQANSYIPKKDCNDHHRKDKDCIIKTNCASNSGANHLEIKFQPRITIAIPTHKRPHYLREAIKSALQQKTDSVSYEILVISDGHHPDTEIVVSEFDSNRLRFIQKKHSGAVGTRNMAICKAHGDYIVWLDDDDLLEPNALSTHLSVLSQYPDTDVVYGKLDYFDDRTGKFLRRFDPKDWHAKSHDLLSALIDGCRIPNPATMVKKGAYEQVGGYNEAFLRAHDYEFWTRAASELKFKKNDNVVCRYRIHSNNMSFGNKIDFSYESLIIRNMVYRYGPKKIFYWLDWNKPDEADVVSKYLTAKSLYSYGDYYNCHKILNQIPQYLWSKDISKLGFYCSLFMGETRRSDLYRFTQNEQLKNTLSKFRRLSKKLKNAIASGKIDKCRQILIDYQTNGFSPTPAILLKLGILYNTFGDRDDSINIFKRVQMLNPYIFDQNKNVLNHFDSEDVEKICSPSKRILSSVPIFQKGNRREPRSNDSIGANATLETAKCHYQFENYRSSLDVLNRILAVDPNNWDAYSLLMDVLLQSGQNKDISSYFFNLESRSDLPARMLALVGCGYEASGHLEKAARFGDQALTRDAECSRAWNLKGVVAYRNGQPAKAAQYFQRASETDHEWGDPWTNMGTLHWENGTRDMALACFEKGFHLSPTAPNVATTYHTAVSETGQYNHAKPLFEKAVKQHPDFRKARLLLIDILIRLEAFPEALEQIEEVLVRFGADPQLLEAAKAVRAKVGPMTIHKDKHPSLSLCMIVKNEEKYLPRCLESLKPMVDEMIVVDTGSNDATRGIAEVFGAKVFDFEWNNDFAAARNYSLKQASGDWILVMDADEVIAASDHCKLLDLITKSESEKSAYVLTTRTYTDRQDSADYTKNTRQYNEEMSTGWVPSKKVRLFQNHEGVHFVFPVHEQVDPVLTEMGVSIIESPVPVHHYGKLDQARTAERWQTYYDIGHKKLASQSDNDHALKELAIQAGLLSKWEEAATHWKSFIDRNPDSVDGYLNLTRVMANCGDYEQANQYANKAFQLAGDRSETNYNLALSELQTGRAAKAAQTANRMVATFPEDLDGKLLHALAKICAGKIDEGNKLLCKLSEIVPIASLLPRIRSILGSIKSAGFDEWVVSLKTELSKVVNLKDTVVQPATPPVKKAGVIDKTTVGADENASTLLEKALRDYEKENYRAALDSLLHILSTESDHCEAYELLVDLMQQSGQDTDILNYLRPLENRSNLTAKMMVLIGHGYEASGNLEKAADFVAQAITIDPECARAWNLKGVIAYRNGHASEATQFFQKASECDEKWGDPWTNMGTLHWVHEDQDKALDCFETGFQLSPTGPNVAATYHVAISGTGQYERAKPLFEQAVKHHPDFRKGHFLLIDILIRLEIYQEALNQIETVLVHFGADPQFLEAAKTIRDKVGPVTIHKDKHPSLSLCMIVKNEEKYLARCLESLKPMVDEMIIVDTGSTDTTRDIAEVFGAHVFDYEWNDDFAAARNYSLDQARGDWILVMDADEVIATKDHAKIHKLLEQTGAKNRAFTIVTRNYTHQYNIIGWESNTGQYPDEEAGVGWVPSEKVRLFPNISGIRFDYPVHEVVGPSLNRKNIAIKSCPCPVHHYGKMDEALNQVKGEQYFNIGMAKLSDSQDNPVAIRELAVQAAKLGKHRDSIMLWKRLIEHQPHDARSYVNLSSNHGKLQQYHEAKKAAQKAISLSPNLKEGHLNLGRSELLLGNFVKAETIFKKLFKKNRRYYQALFLLGATQFCQGKFDEGVETLQSLRDVEKLWNNLPYSLQELDGNLLAAGMPEVSRNLMMGSETLSCSNGAIKGLKRKLNTQAA